MLRHFFILFLASHNIFLSGNLHAQPINNSTPQGNKQPQTYLCAELKNTYQVQVLNTRSETSLPVNLCDLIKKNRHLTDTVYIRISEIARVMILPENNRIKADVPDYIHIGI